LTDRWIAASEPQLDADISLSLHPYTCSPCPDAVDEDEAATPSINPAVSASGIAVLTVPENAHLASGGSSVCFRADPDRLPTPAHPGKRLGRDS
jgi:hypothetical protein